MMLADLGARVVKIEPPGGDETRGWGPPFQGGVSTYFLSANRGKESAVLDLKRPYGRRALDRWIRRSDILIENFRPSSAARLGVDPARTRRVNPRLIHCAISGYGRRGRWAEKPAYDLVIQAESGAMLLNGDPAGPPMKIGVTIADVLAAHYAVQAVLAARLSGGGATIEVSLLDSMIAGFTHHAQSFLSTGRVPARHGNDHPSLYPYSVFRAADGDVAIAVANDAQWAGLCRALGFDAKRYPSNRDRVLGRQRLRRELASKLSARPSGELLRALQRRGVPSGRVQSLREAMGMASGLILRGRVASPIRVNGRRWTSKTPPMLGGSKADG
jgi:crotonobetainyl-CoA:carnitine CoA-transferase CaiB-like acyl-CoA transferase